MGTGRSGLRLSVICTVVVTDVVVSRVYSIVSGTNTTVIYSPDKRCWVHGPQLQIMVDKVIKCVRILECHLLKNFWLLRVETYIAKNTFFHKKLKKLKDSGCSGFWELIFSRFSPKSLHNIDDWLMWLYDVKKVGQFFTESYPRIITTSIYSNMDVFPNRLLKFLAVVCAPSWYRSNPIGWQSKSGLLRISWTFDLMYNWIAVPGILCFLWLQAGH